MMRGHDDTSHSRATGPRRGLGRYPAAAASQAAPSQGGRPWIEDRAVLGGIIDVLRAGIPWRLLPAKELGCGGGVTCWRRLRDWQQAGVWEALHHRLRRAVGCLDVAICADLVDPGGVNISERWESQAALETFRSSGPDTEQRPAMLTVSVQEYDIADVRPVFGKGAE
jgi:transposase